MASFEEREGEGISTPDLLDRLTVQGYPTTVRQLQRWRESRLLPPIDQEGRYHGSVVWHSVETFGRVVAIQRGLSVKNKLDFVGAAMWLAGFDVDERYWAKTLEDNDKLMRRAAPMVRYSAKLFEKRWENRTIGDLVARMSGGPALFTSISRRLDSHEIAAVSNVGLEIAGGKFEQFAHPDYAEKAERGDDYQSMAQVFDRAFDLDKGKTDSINGMSLKLSEQLEAALKSISDIQIGSRIAEFSPIEIQQARDDVRDTLKALICFYQSVRWIYGDQAFGLRFISKFARTFSGNFIFLTTLGFARLRRTKFPMLSSGAIAALADQAEKAWLISDYFRELCLSRPDLAHLIGPERMKLSFSSSAEQLNLLEELKGYQFPEPQFRPWDGWQKLAKRTTSPGLIVMSIGSPETFTLAEVKAGANGLDAL